MKKLEKIKKNELKSNHSVLSRDGMKAIKGGVNGYSENPLFEGQKNDFESPVFAE